MAHTGQSLKRVRVKQTLDRISEKARLVELCTEEFMTLVNIRDPQSLCLNMFLR